MDINEQLQPIVASLIDSLKVAVRLEFDPILPNLACVFVKKGINTS